MNPPALPTLSKSVFNSSLYNEILDLWFEGVPEDARSVPDETVKRWYGAGGEASKKSFDESCHNIATAALKALAPDAFPLPKFIDFETDRENAERISEPLRETLLQVSESGMDVTRAAIALAILLDQMPRNTLRDLAGQRIVYTHYDRIARALVHFMFDGRYRNDPLHNIDWSEKIKLAPFRRFWLYMPLEHSEDPEDHKLFFARVDGLEESLAVLGDQGVLKSFQRDFGFEKQHREIIERFGRYPHRNQALGRDMTTEEQAWLAEGGATFGTSNEKK